MSTETIREIEPFEIQQIACKTKLSAELWRAIAVAERPSPYIGDSITVVVATDDRESVAVLPSRHYDTLVHRLRTLEAWVTECMEEDQQQ